MVLALILIAGVGFIVWTEQHASRTPSAEAPAAATLAPETARVISYSTHGFSFRVPEGWWIDDYFDDDLTSQRGDTIIDDSEELSRFINLRNFTVPDAELDLALTPNFDDDDLAPLPYREFTYGDGTYQVRYVASCDGDKLIYIEGKGKSLLVSPTEFCDTPAYKEFDMDATFRAIAEGFRFTE